MASDSNRDRGRSRRGAMTPTPTAGETSDGQVVKKKRSMSLSRVAKEGFLRLKRSFSNPNLSARDEEAPPPVPQIPDQYRGRYAAMRSQPITTDRSTSSRVGSSAEDTIHSMDSIDKLLYPEKVRTDLPRSPQQQQQQQQRQVETGSLSGLCSARNVMEPDGAGSESTKPKIGEAEETEPKAMGTPTNGFLKKLRSFSSLRKREVTTPDLSPTGPATAPLPSTSSFSPTLRFSPSPSNLRNKFMAGSSSTLTSAKSAFVLNSPSSQRRNYIPSRQPQRTQSQVKRSIANSFALTRQAYESYTAAKTPWKKRIQRRELQQTLAELGSEFVKRNSTTGNLVLAFNGSPRDVVLLMHQYQMEWEDVVLAVQEYKNRVAKVAIKDEARAHRRAFTKRLINLFTLHSQEEAAAMKASTGSEGPLWPKTTFSRDGSHDATLGGHSQTSLHDMDFACRGVDEGHGLGIDNVIPEEDLPQNHGKDNSFSPPLHSSNYQPSSSRHPHGDHPNRKQRLPPTRESIFLPNGHKELNDYLYGEDHRFTPRKSTIGVPVTNDDDSDYSISFGDADSIVRAPISWIASKRHSEGERKDSVLSPSSPSSSPLHDYHSKSSMTSDRADWESVASTVDDSHDRLTFPIPEEDEDGIDDDDDDDAATPRASPIPRSTQPKEEDLDDTIAAWGSGSSSSATSSPASTLPARGSVSKYVLPPIDFGTKISEGLEKVILPERLRVVSNPRRSE